MADRLRLIFFGTWLLGLIALGWRIYPGPSAQNHKTPALAIWPAFVQDQTPFKASLLPNSQASAHSSSIVYFRSPQGDTELFITWFAGSREGASDVKLYASKTIAGQWQTPWVVMERSQVMHSQWRYIKKIGNPLIYQTPDKPARLHLLFVTVSLGGWAGSRLNYSYSDDVGQTWQSPRQLQLSPLFNVSTLVRNAPSIAGQEVWVPVYHETVHKYPQLLRLNFAGQVLGLQRLDGGASGLDMLQPSLVLQADTVVPVDASLESNATKTAHNAHEPQTLETTASASSAHENNHTMYKLWLRNARNDKYAGRLGYIESSNGRDFGAVHWLNVPNSDSSVSVVLAADNTFVMAYNAPSRARLLLATSRDGVRWRERYIVEDQAGGEFSYPSLITHNGRLDLSYTYRRKQIKHLQFNLDWLLQQEGKAVTARPAR